MRFLVRFSLGLLLSVSLGLLLPYCGTAYPDLAARAAEPNYALPTGRAALPLTAARYRALRGGLALVAGGAGLGLLALPRRRRRRPPPHWRRRQPWTWGPVLSRGEWLVAAAVLGGAAGLRLWWAGHYPLTVDELASYDYAVLPGAALTASYYPIPNNHLLANLVVGAVHALLPGAPATLALRLGPTVLGLAVLPLGYALLRRYLGFGVATLSWGLFSLSPLPAFYAVAGRGYGWGLAALLAGLGATLALLRPQGLARAGRQRAWALFGVSAVLGLYAVPTHLYGLLGLGLALLVGLSRPPRRRRRLQLRHLAVAAAGVGGAVAVLYAPVVAVSGWPALVANPYVGRLSAPEFWAHLGSYYLLGTASELLGRREASAALFGLVAGLTPWVLWRGGLPEPARRLGWVAYAQLVLWLPLVLAQRVYPPARTLLAVLLALLVLAALVARAGWQWARPARATSAPPGVKLLALVVVLGSYGAYRLHREQVVMRQQFYRQQQFERAYQWLRAQQPRRVWVSERQRTVAIFWHHYALATHAKPLPLVLVEAPAAAAAGPPGPGEDFELLPAPPAGAPAAYAEGSLVLVRHPRRRSR